MNEKEHKLTRDDVEPRGFKLTAVVPVCPLDVTVVGCDFSLALLLLIALGVDGVVWAGCVT